MGLSHQAQHLGVTTLAVDDDLRRVGARFNAIECGVDALLQLEHHRTGGVDDFDAVASGGLVGLGRFAMGAQQHLHVMQLFKLLVRDGFQAAAGQTVHLGSVVHDVAQAVKVPALLKLLLGLADGCRHTEAKPRSLVNLNNRHSFGCQFVEYFVELYSSLLADANP